MRKDRQHLRNQIYDVFIRTRIRMQLYQKTYQSAEIGFVHNPVIIKVRLKMELTKRTTGNININTCRLRDKIKMKYFSTEIN